MKWHTWTNSPLDYLDANNLYTSDCELVTIAEFAGNFTITRAVVVAFTGDIDHACMWLEDHGVEPR